MMSLSLIKQLVEEMEYVLSCINENKVPFDGDDFHEALRLGRQAIARAEGTLEAEKQCTHRLVDVTNPVVKSGYMCMDCGALFGAYTQKPEAEKRNWEGLSIFEINDLVENTEYEDYRDLVERTEAKLKEKNFS